LVWLRRKGCRCRRENYFESGGWWRSQLKGESLLCGRAMTLLKLLQQSWKIWHLLTVKGRCMFSGKVIVKGCCMVFTTRNSFNTNRIANGIILSVIWGRHYRHTLLCRSFCRYISTTKICRYIPMKLRTECWEFKKWGRFPDVEVIAGIFYQRNHQGIQNVSSVRWCDWFIDGNADEITEGFKMSAPYDDVTDSPMQMPTESPTDSKWVTYPVCRQISRWNHRRNSPSVKPSIKVNISPLTRPYPPLILLLLPHLNSPQLQTTNAPPKKKSPSSQHNKSYILKSSCHSIRVLIYRWIFISFCK
jgi:hypothetical protein